MITRIVYQSHPYTVTLNKHPKIPIEWVVTNGEYSFSLGEEPVMDKASLDEMMRDYLTERKLELGGDDKTVREPAE